MFEYNFKSKVVTHNPENVLIQGNQCGWVYYCLCYLWVPIFEILAHRWAPAVGWVNLLLS